MPSYQPKQTGKEIAAEDCFWWPLSRSIAMFLYDDPGRDPHGRNVGPSMSSQIKKRPLMVSSCFQEICGFVLGHCLCLVLMFALWNKNRLTPMTCGEKLQKNITGLTEQKCFNLSPLKKSPTYWAVLSNLRFWPFDLKNDLKIQIWPSSATVVWGCPSFSIL